jgi:hypothetical protein
MAEVRAFTDALKLAAQYLSAECSVELWIFDPGADPNWNLVSIGDIKPDETGAIQLEPFA